MGFTDDVIDNGVSDIVMAGIVFTAVQEIFYIAISPFDGREGQAQRRQTAGGDAVRDVADDVAVDLDIADDAAVLEQVDGLAEEILSADPKLNKPENGLLRQNVQRLFGANGEYSGN